MKIVVVSGGFDPLHSVHLDHMVEARRLGDWLIVIVNTDEFLIKKKGFFILPLLERLRIIEEYPFVDQTVVCIDRDQTVAETLRLVRPNIFAKGGDRTGSHMPKKELEACKELRCKVIYGVDRGVRRSSTDFLLEATSIIEKPWGYEKVLLSTDSYSMKTLHINQGARLSKQVHKGRDEVWRVLEGLPLVEANGEEHSFGVSALIPISAGMVHRISAPQGDVTLLEMSLPHLDMEEITRLEDNHGRT